MAAQDINGSVLQAAQKFTNLTEAAPIPTSRESAIAVYRLPTSAATVNATLVKAGAGKLYSIIAHNASAAVRFIKIYDKATAPTVGTDTPLLVFAIPAGGMMSVALAPLAFTAGLGFGYSTGAADNSTGAVAANDIFGLNLVYT